MHWQRRTSGMPAGMPPGVRLFLETAVLIAALTLICGCAIAWPVRVPTLDIYDSRGDRLASLLLSDGIFVHSYIHSINKTRVDEFLRVDGNAFVLYELRYDSYGVGMPSGAEDGFRLENGRFVLAMHREFTRIDVWISPVPGHGVVIGGELHPFTEWAPREQLLTLRPGSVLKVFSRR